MERGLNLPLRNVLKKMQSRIMEDTSYHGIRTHKNPLDFWVYQEIIWEQKPDVIIEIGNRFGGSTLALAHQLDLIDHGRLIGIDIDHSPIAQAVRAHARVALIEAPALEALSTVREHLEPGVRVMMIEDSSHTYDHTLNVLRTYSELIGPGGYFIVEDTICHHGLSVGPSPGPYEAVETFLSETTEFEVDREREAFYITWNPKGFLRRKS